jgi:hypothetical protein
MNTNNFLGRLFHSNISHLAAMALITLACGMEIGKRVGRCGYFAFAVSCSSLAQKATFEGAET